MLYGFHEPKNHKIIGMPKKILLRVYAGILQFKREAGFVWLGLVRVISIYYGEITIE